MPDSWLADYSSCSQLSQDVVELINERNNDARLRENVISINMLIKKDLFNLKRMVEKLKLGLYNSSKNNIATHGEMERRQNLLDTLITKVRILSEAANSGRLPSTSETNVSERNDLLLARSDSRTSTSNQWLESEERIAALGAEEFRSRCDEVIKVQDVGLDRLSETIKRQKEIGINIGNEADYQNVLIDDIHTRVEDTNQRIHDQTDQTINVRKTSSNSTCILLLIAIGLAIAIVVVFFTGGKR